MTKAQKKIVSAALMTAALLALSGCGPKKKPVAEETTEATFAVNVQKAVPSTLDNYLEFSGDVQAASSVDIIPDTSGKVSRLLARVGDVVKKDQIVAYIDPSSPGMVYNVSPVKAAVGGTITSFPANIGTTVNMGYSMGKISSTGRLEIKTHIAERFISRVSFGQSAILSFDAYPGEDFPAKLVEIDPVLDSSSRSLGVKLIQDPPDERLRAGMYARIHLITDTRENTIVVKKDVILTRSDGNYVFVADPTTNVARIKAVKTGIKVDDNIEIIDGLSEGDLIITKGQTLLSDGAKIRIINKVEI